MIRVPITITVFDKVTNKKVEAVQYLVKTRAIKKAAQLLKTYGNDNFTFECKMTYSLKRDSWNAFDFTSQVELENNIPVFLDLSLLKDLIGCGMMDKEYIR